METLTKINKETQKLYRVDAKLFVILERAGQDSETEYTSEYLDLLEDLKALRSGLRALLANHNETINELEYALEG